MVLNFSGICKKIYHRNQATGYTGLGIETDEIDVIRNSDGLVFCTGVLPDWSESTQLLLTGVWKGSVFQISTAKAYTETLDASKQLLKRITEEMVEENPEWKISMVGRKRILTVTGPDILTYTKNTTKEDWIRTFPKIKKETLDVLYNRLFATVASFDLLDYLLKFGGTISDCDRLLKYYGKSAYQKLNRNPYKTGSSIGMNFFVCDRIGKSRKLDFLMKSRVRFLIQTAFDRLSKNTGSTCVTQYTLEKEVNRLERRSCYPDDRIPKAVFAELLVRMDSFVIELFANGSRIYRKDYYQAEKNIARNCKRLNQRKNQKSYRDSYLSDAEKTLGITYSEKQKEAFSLLKSTGVKILTGGPGTGKTTVVNGLLYVYQKMNPKGKICLCAPTGRAAQRMSEVTGMEASTIHRTLNFRPFEKEMISKDADDPIEADLIILDEMSMVDTLLFSKFLPAVKNGTTVILIGDEDQLPSVESGNILHDMIQSEQFEMVRLKEVFRQSDHGFLLENAYEILEGRIPEKMDETYQWICCENDKEGLEQLKNCFQRENPFILSPLRKGEFGTRNINEQLSLLVKRESKDSYSYGDLVFHKGDPVIFEKNNYEKEYFNGDIGIITEMIPHGFVVNIKGENKSITGECLGDVSLAFAITVHKSQGSEANNIVIFLPETSFTNRNLLFTGITRAKKKVTILATRKALTIAVSNKSKEKRKTGLVDKLLGKKIEVLK